MGVGGGGGWSRFALLCTGAAKPKFTPPPLPPSPSVLIQGLFFLFFVLFFLWFFTKPMLLKASGLVFLVGWHVWTPLCVGAHLGLKKFCFEYFYI